MGDGYARLGSEDSRFSDHYGGLQSIVTSTAQNDSGMFETNLRDDRYLPFENSGVISDKKADLFIDTKEETVSVSYKADVTEPQVLGKDSSFGNLRAGKLANLPSSMKPFSNTDEKLTIYLTDQSIKDIWLAIAWGKES